MTTAKRFIADLKKYWSYAIYSAKADLKSEVANSYLNWIWWILEPLCMMLIYAFIFGYVFGATEQYFPIFIFLGLTFWNFFSHVVQNSVKNIKSNKAIIRKVYIPKHILLIQKMMVHAFKMLVAFAIIVLMMIVWRVKLSLQILYVPFVLVDLILFTFAVAVHLQHFGVFVMDLNNFINIALRLVFYLTGIMYNIRTRIPGIAGTLLLKLNPMATILDAMRRCILYAKQPDIGMLIVIFFGSILLALWGVKRIYKYENSYAKVV